MKILRRQAAHMLYLIAGILFLFTLGRGSIIACSQVRSIYSGTDIKSESVLSDLNDQWQLLHTDGSSEVITLPMELPPEASDVVIRRDVTGVFHTGDIIQFDNMRQGLIVSADSTDIYAVNTTKLNLQVSYTDLQLVAIPNAESIRELSIRFVHTDSDHYILPAIRTGSQYAAGSVIIREDLLTLSLLELMAVCMLIVIIISIYLHIHKLPASQSIDLALFIFTVMLWGFSDSYCAVLTGIPQEVLGLFNYLSLLCIPIPICNFIWHSYKEKYPIFRVLSLISAVNMVVQTVLSTVGIIRLQNTFYAAHVEILVLIVFSLVCMFKMQKEDQHKEMQILHIGILTLAAMAVTAIIMFWQKGGSYYRIFMLIGILCFSAILCLSEVVRYMRKIQNDRVRLSEIEIHERLSYYDPLTGLPNRRLFEKELHEIETKLDPDSDAVLIMMDVNGLKLVNDNYGHAAGDDLIAAASRSIDSTYGKYGSCFRIGGDEFVVILTDMTVSLFGLERQLDDTIAAMNEKSKWKLSIARGTSHLLHDPGHKLSISDWKQEADVNMYRNKVTMTGNKSRDRAKDLSDIITCIISTIEAKDTYTAAHSERVRELSEHIARRLGVSDSTIANLATAAYLHDIGKIGIPDYILLKPDMLTAVEYEKLKQHTQIGAGIVGHAKGMVEISNIILHHHERWDGNGYPDGLSGEDIPLESRIIALADSIDAMTSNRVYRKCRSTDECRWEIKRNSGIMYDPAITAIVLQNWQEIVDIIMLHPKRLIAQDGIIAESSQL